MKVFAFLIMAGLISCDTGVHDSKVAPDSIVATTIGPATDADSVSQTDPPVQVAQASTTPDELMKFAETQIGVPYVYGSCDPKVGFDCSGFITYVFNHFHIPVPRSSYEFTHIGETIPFSEAKRGDVILFTGTDSLSTDIGHIGLVVSNINGVLNFIHSTSGKAMAVTVTTFDEHYMKRFVRVCRIF